jgi:uncharacterized protein DUF1844
MGKDEDQQPSRGFKVEDRRRFVDDAEPVATAGKAEEPAPRAEPSAAPADPAETHVHGPGEAHVHGAHEEPHQEINFSTFVMGLTTQALMHLGEIAEPGVPPTPDLAAAKQMIDLLGILRDKTTGNLDPAEDQLLASMLYDLRMRYVEVSRHR